MNQKEISELKRRFWSDKNAISRSYGCYVNSSKEVISYYNRFTVKGTATSRVFFRIVAKAVRMESVGLTFISKN